MGWFSKTWKKVKNVFKKVTKVVKKVVKAVGKTAKKVWNKVKGVAKKFSKGISKLGPFANIAMKFIPGFGQPWAAYGIWGQMAKGAIVGFATSGEAIGALLGAATMGAADIFKKNDMLWMACGVRCVSTTDEDIKYYKDSGCSSLKYGIETGSQKILDLMVKY